MNAPVDSNYGIFIFLEFQQLLNEHPFHVDSMLQLSDICKMGEDSQMATELVERTLFVMEASFHTMFSLTSGTSRLDYRRQENRYEYPVKISLAPIS